MVGKTQKRSYTLKSNFFLLTFKISAKLTPNNFLIINSIKVKFHGRECLTTRSTRRLNSQGFVFIRIKFDGDQQPIWLCAKLTWRFPFDINKLFPLGIKPSKTSRKALSFYIVGYKNIPYCTQEHSILFFYRKKGIVRYILNFDCVVKTGNKFGSSKNNTLNPFIYLIICLMGNDKMENMFLISERWEIKTIIYGGVTTDFATQFLSVLYCLIALTLSGIVKTVTTQLFSIDVNSTLNWSHQQHSLTQRLQKPYTPTRV